MTNSLNLRLLTSEEVNTIYDKCLDYLSKKGVKVDHPQALKIFEKAGAQVDVHDKQVRFPRDVTEMALRSVPHSLTLSGRNERNDVVPHPSGLFYARSNTGSRSYIDPDSNTCRNVTLADVAEWGQLTEALDEISFCCFLTPRDVPGETSDIHALKAVFENTSKHIIVQPHSFDSVEYLFRLAEVVAGSTDALKKKPIIEIMSCSITPLAFKNMDVEVIIQAARHGVPISASSLPSAGATSPITLAGTVLVCGIEVLAQIVMSQLLQPGLPVIGQTPFYTLDMLNARNLGSSVGAILGGAATVQFMNDAFHVPTHTLGFATDSYIADGQYMIETTLRGLVISLAGCDILGGAGRLNALSASSPIQLIIDNTIVSILKQVKSGMKVDDETLAWEDILDTVPGGHFLERAHTLRHCREALRTELFVQQSLESWTSEGSKDLYRRAVDKYNELKKRLQPQQLPQEVQTEMDRIVKQADERLGK